MPISLTLLLAIAGVALLAYGFGSIAGVTRVLTGGAALLVALASSAATIGLFWLGHQHNWTSDGPGALFVMLAVVVFGIVTVVAWMFVFGVALTAAVPAGAFPDAPRDLKRVFRLTGFALLGIAAVGQGITAFARRARAAHSAPVIAVAFDTGSPGLVTADAAGTFVDWDLDSKREARRWTSPALAGATEIFVGGPRNFGYAIANGKAVRFWPFKDTPIETIPDARFIALGAAVVIARDRALLFASYVDWTQPPYHELAWPEPIRAIAARDMFVAVADGTSISLLDGRPRYVQTLASVPAPGQVTGLKVLQDGIVVALDGNGAAWAIDVRRGVTEPVAAKASLVAGARHVYSVWGCEVSEYDPHQKTATAVATIAAGARSIDTWGEHVAFGFEAGEVVLGTRRGATLETTRLTAKPIER